MFVLRIKPEDCSLLGKEILNFTEQNQLSMTEMARRTGITQPGLRAIVLKRGSPTKINIDKLARVMGKSPSKLYQLVYEEKLKIMAFPHDPNYDPNFLLVIFNNLLKSFWKYTAHLPKNKRPSDYELFDKAFKIIKFFN